MKECSKCEEEKELSEFYRDNRGNKNKYVNRCKCCIRKQQKQHYEDNKDKKRRYYENNREEKRNYDKKYYKCNKDKIKETQINNKDRINERRKERRKEEPLYKLSTNIRCAINRSLKNKKIIKSSHTYEILGCDFNELLNHLNSNNYDFRYEDGLYDIDHIIPLSSATTEEEIYKLNHYTNLQLLPSHYNQFIKRDNDWDEANFKEWLLKDNI